MPHKSSHETVHGSRLAGIEEELRKDDHTQHDGQPPSDVVQGTARPNAHEYGPIELTGKAMAHLGDNILSGAITVQQMNLMIGEEQIRDVIAAARPSKDPDLLLELVLQGGTDRRDTVSDLQSRSRHSASFRTPTVVNIELMTALYFREESYRKWDIKEAHRQTFAWIFSPKGEKEESPHSDFVAWLREDIGCYWINGKAGSGKSTLMKFIAGHEATKEHLKHWAAGKEHVLATFFFWHLGSRLQKSHEGILRSLLHQVLRARPKLAANLFPRLFLHLLIGDDTEDLELSMYDLKHALDLLLANMPEDLVVLLMIDGVDEYSGDHFDFCQLLMRITQCPSIKILVSSRPLPVCCTFFSDCPGLRVQDLTVTDVQQYVRDELLEHSLLKKMDLRQPGFAKLVEESLALKASGVFLWIVLVVKNLLIGLAHYEDRNTLISKIDQLPSDLETLYDHMFSSMDPQHLHEGSLLMLLIDYALKEQNAVGLTALQVSFLDPAMNFSSPSAGTHRLTDAQKSLRIEDVEGRLRSRCQGLLEVQYRRHIAWLSEPQVGYLHRTVVEYLKEYDILEKFRKKHQLPPGRLDSLLLSSFPPTIRNLTLDETEKSFEHTRASDVLKLCLRHGKNLEALGDTAYSQPLQEVDSFLLDWISKKSGVAGAVDYNRFYFQNNFTVANFEVDDETLESNNQKKALLHNIALRDHPLPFPNRIDEALWCIACWGLTAFWRRKLASCPKASFSAMGLSLRLLAAIKTQKGKNCGHLAKNLEVLLENIEPNALASERDNPWCVKDENAASLSPENDSNLISPWNFWLSHELNPSIEELSVTVAFVRAGAELHSEHPPKEHALMRLAHAVRSFGPHEFTPASKRSAAKWAELLELIEPIPEQKTPEPRKQYQETQTELQPLPELVELTPPIPRQKTPEPEKLHQQMETERHPFPNPDREGGLPEPNLRKAEPPKAEPPKAESAILVPQKIDPPVSHRSKLKLFFKRPPKSPEIR